MSKKFLFLFIILSAAKNVLQAQNTFQKEVKPLGGSYPYLYDAAPTADGGYILCFGDSAFYPANTFTLARLNASAQQVWTKRLLYNGYGINPYCAGEKINGGYYCFGTIDSSNTSSSPRQFFMGSFDNNGNLQWVKKYAVASGFVQLYTPPIVKQLPNGDFAISMNQNTMGIMRIDQNGNLLWGREFYNDQSKNPGFDVLPTPDGGFISCGKRDRDKMFVKVDGNGTVQWSKILIDSINSYNRIYSMINTNDGNILCAGLQANPLPEGYNGFVMKMNTNGNPLWYKTYHVSNYSRVFYFKKVIALNNGNYALLGVDMTSYNISLPVIVIIDNSGNLISSQKIGSSSGSYFIPDEGFKFYKTASDDLMLTYNQYDQLPNSGASHHYLFKSDGLSMLWCDKNDYPLVVNSLNYNPNSSSSLTQYPSGVQGALTLSVSPASLSITNYCSSSGIAQTGTAEVSIYPNPAADFITVILGPVDGGINSAKNLVLYNSIGQAAGIWNLAAGENKIDVSPLPKGIYFYTTGSQGGKIVIER